MRSIVERAFAAVCLLLLLPLLLLTALIIWLDGGWPVFFRQRRVGEHGHMFDLLKFRSMRTNTGGARITAGNDSRITPVGTVLRRYKIDELPQLWNIVRGEMQFVGPRPEVPLFVDAKHPLWQKVLATKPGLTDLATLVYRHEESVLAGARNPEETYKTSILPDKLALSAHYQAMRSLRTDLTLLGLTARYSFIPAGFNAMRIRERF